ncbi:MAG: HlyD family efflux transporter periplasmic adaptor subunit [Phycisphaerales bacterium]
MSDSSPAATDHRRDVVSSTTGGPTRDARATSHAAIESRSRLGAAVSVATRVVVCAVLLLGAVGVYAALVATRPVLKSETTGDSAQRVLVFAPRLMAVRRQWNGFGTAGAIERAEVPARVASTVVAIPRRVVAGAAVAKGDVLALLDDSDFQRQFEVATTTLAEIDAQLARLDVEQRAWEERVRIADEQTRLLRADADRVTQARLDGAAKEREMDQALARVLDAERAAIAAREEFDKLPSRRAGLLAQREGQLAAKRLAQQSIERCRIASPLDGVIQSMHVKEGESLRPGEAVARVVNLARIEVPLLLPASARPELATGDEVLLLDDGPSSSGGAARHGRRWSAIVSRIAPEDDASTRTMTVFAELTQDPALPDALAPGRFVQGVVTSERPVVRMLLPRRAVRSDRVFVVADERIARREIVPDFPVEGDFPPLGLPDTSWIALRAPLPDGDLVVLDGSRSLEAGVKAAAVLPAAAAPSLDATAHSEGAGATVGSPVGGGAPHAPPSGDAARAEIVR